MAFSASFGSSTRTPAALSSAKLAYRRWRLIIEGFHVASNTIVSQVASAIGTI
jgi:hypothetical protein